MTESKNQLEPFATKYRVKMTRGTQGSENLVLGKYGEIADDYGDGILRLRLLATPRHRTMEAILTNRKQQAMAAGMTPLRVTAHVAESMWGFDPGNDAHCKLAVELVSPKRRRQYSEQTLIAMRARLARFNGKVPVQAEIPSANLTDGPQPHPDGCLVFDHSGTV